MPPADHSVLGAYCKFFFISSVHAILGADIYKKAVHFSSLPESLYFRTQFITCFTFLNFIFTKFMGTDPFPRQAIFPGTKKKLFFP